MHVKPEEIMDTLNATDGTPEPEAPPVPVEVEPPPAALTVDVEAPAEDVPVEGQDDLAQDLSDLAVALTRKDAKSRALRTLVQSGLLHTLFSVLLVVVPYVMNRNFSTVDWKAVGILALSTAGHGLAALLMRLLSDPNAE